MQSSGLAAVIEPLIALILVGVGVAWYKQAGSGGAVMQRRRSGHRVASPILPPRPLPGSPGVVQSPGRPRILQAVALNPADHPYDEMTLDGLQEHLFHAHWETWNLTVGKDRAPSTWRKRHADDHGLVVR